MMPSRDDRRQSPSRAGVGKHLLIECGVVGHDNLSVQDARELVPNLRQPRRVGDGTIRDSMDRFGVAGYCDRGTNELIHNDDAAAVDNSDVDHVVETEANAGRLSVQVEHIGAVNQIPCPRERLLATFEWFHHAPAAGLAARKTAR